MSRSTVHRRPRYSIVLSDRKAIRLYLSKRSAFNRANGCLEWNGCTARGYGRVTIDGIGYSTHRLSAHAFLGFDLESRLYVCHKCDNKKCIRPDHLFIGECIDNVRDMMKKGRFPLRYGEFGGNARLTNKDVLGIRALYKDGCKVSELSRKYGLSYTGTSSICLNKSWKHLLRTS
jgi:hypothetical protein